MEILAAIGGASFLLVCIVGGARLLLLARRTRELPELILGAGLFLLGGVATPLAALARAPIDVSDATRIAMLLGQTLMLVAGMAGFAHFTYSVFRRESRWARWLARALPAGMLLGIAATGLQAGGFQAVLALEIPAGYVLNQLCLMATLGWAGFESLRYAGILKRRLRLGLADPVVVDRVRLWGIAMSLATLLCVLTVGGQLAGVELLGTVAGSALVGCIGFVAGSALYLAFLPPTFYTRWVSARGSLAK